MLKNESLADTTDGASKISISDSSEKSNPENEEISSSHQSLQTSDAEYMDAVDRGDMETAQAMKAADERVRRVIDKAKADAQTQKTTFDLELQAEKERSNAALEELAKNARERYDARTRVFLCLFYALNITSHEKKPCKTHKREDYKVFWWWR